MADYSQKYCNNCDKNVLAVRKSTNHILHLLLSLLTVGLWIPIWILLSIRMGDWRCTVCGKILFLNFPLSQNNQVDKTKSLEYEDLSEIYEKRKKRRENIYFIMVISVIIIILLLTIHFFMVSKGYEFAPF